MASRKNILKDRPLAVEPDRVIALGGELATRESFTRIVNYSNYLPDPDIVLKKAGLGVYGYRELETDDTIGSCITQRKAGVLNMLYEIKAQPNQTVREEITALFRSLNLRNIFNQILNSIYYGYSVFEIIWEQKNGFWIPKDICEKPREWFVFNLQNELEFNRLGLLQANNTYLSFPSFIGNPPEGPLPNFKFITAQHNPTYENPYGEKILSRCYWYYKFKKGGMSFWSLFLEKYGMPTAVGKLPSNAPTEDRNNLLNALSNVVRDGVVVIPDNNSVELLTFTNQNSSQAYSDYIAFCDTAIQKAILTQTLTTDMSAKGGSYAASQTHSKMLEFLQESDKSIIENVFNQLLNWIYELNFAGEVAPKFCLYNPIDVDKDLADRDKVLTDTGIKFSKEYYMRAYNLNDSDFELVSSAPASQHTTNFAAAKNSTIEVGNTKHVLDEINMPKEDLANAMNKLLEPLFSKLAKATDFAEAEKEILKIYPDLDSSELQMILQKAIFVGELYGRL